jgi:hypothetical protein
MFVPDDARSGGLMVFGPSGWGKSRLLGRSTVFDDLKSGVGQVVLDAVGGTIDNCLDKVLRLPPAKQRQILKRIRYCNMAGQRVGSDIHDAIVTPFPVLTKRTTQESLNERSQRFIDLVQKTDENFASASIQGLPRFIHYLTPVLQVLSALDLPITFAYDMLTAPEEWQDVIKTAANQNPEAKLAAEELLKLPNLNPRSIEERFDPIRTRLGIFKWDLVVRAMFGSTTPLIDWDEVSKAGQTVFIDLRYDRNISSRQLKLFWVWNAIREYIDERGLAGTDYPPLGIVIDELSYFVRGDTLNTEVIAEDFRELIQVRKRNANVWLTLATQKPEELPDTLKGACDDMKHTLFGAIQDRETALKYARDWYTVDPFKVKYQRQAMHGEEPQYMDLSEQDYLNSLNFSRLKKGHWLYAQKEGAGESKKSIKPVTTENLDDEEYIDENDPLVTELRTYLMKRDGVRVGDVLSELDPKQMRENRVSADTEDTPAHPQETTKDAKQSGAGEQEEGTEGNGRLKRRGVEDA